MYLYFLFAIVFFHIANGDFCTGKTDSEITVGWPDGYKPNMNCSWNISFSHLESLKNPTLVLFFSQIDLEEYADIVTIYGTVNSSQTVLFSTKQELSNPSTAHLGLWTANPNITLTFVSDFGGQKKGFIVNYYLGFCSDFDGEMDLPSFDLKFVPQQISLISDNFNPINGATTPYRPNSRCKWHIPPLGSGFHIQTLYFYRFDLSKGDIIKILDPWSNLTKTVFDSNHLPVPIATSLPIDVQFYSDSIGEGLGFEADIIRDACSSRTVPLMANTGTITDGSAPTVLYKPGQACSWIVDPVAPFREGGYILIQFNYLNIGSGDELTVFDGDSRFAPKLGSWQETDVLPEPIIAKHEKVFITFKTTDQQNLLPSAESNITGFSLTYQVCTGKCLDCKPGSYYNISENECIPCPHHTVSKEGHQLACLQCPPGHIWVNSQTCDQCLPGSYSTDGSTCNDCEPGHVAPDYAMSSCLSCAASNKYAPNRTNCDTCPEGYTPSSDASTCDTIPIPPKPENDNAVLIYLLVGVGLLIISIVIFVVVKKKKSGDDYESVFSEEW